MAEKVIIKWCIPEEERDEYFIQQVLKGIKGNCYIDSYKTYVKLSKIGAKRVRGMINNKKVFMIQGDPKNPANRVHCWVEAKGMVYDCNEIRQMIMPTELYYRNFKVTNEEFAENGIFLKDNYVLQHGRDDIDKLKRIYPVFA